MESPRGRFAVINIRTLQTITPELMAAEPMDYAAEGLVQKAARREHVWTPVA
jgi:hypothetical protein